jgi:hypothetical protein
MRGNASVAVWALLVLAIFILFVAIPWAIKHPLPHQEHVFGASEKPEHR